MLTSFTGVDYQTLIYRRGSAAMANSGLEPTSDRAEGQIE